MIDIERLVIVIRFHTHRDTSTRFGRNKNIEVSFSPTLLFMFMNYPTGCDCSQAVSVSSLAEICFLALATQSQTACHLQL
jgi:hypothetical protein